MELFLNPRRLDSKNMNDRRYLSFIPPCLIHQPIISMPLFKLFIKMVNKQGEQGKLTGGVFISFWNCMQNLAYLWNFLETGLVTIVKFLKELIMLKS